jgi:hypothetical protein
MAISNHERVGKAMECLSKGLRPFVERELKAHHGAGWEQVVKDCLRFPGKSVNLSDSQVLLAVMWDQWNAVFRRRWARRNAVSSVSFRISATVGRTRGVQQR